jgi:hypothetical protein
MHPLVAGRRQVMRGVSSKCVWLTHSEILQMIADGKGKPAEFESLMKRAQRVPESHLSVIGTATFF